MGIGKQLKQLRLREGLTQETLAQRIGVTPSAVGNYEHEFSFPKEEVLMRIFGALGCSPNELFGEQNIFTAAETELLGKYSELDGHGKEMVGAVLELELKRVRNNSDNEPDETESEDGILIAARKGRQTRIRFKDPDMRVSDLPEHGSGRK